MKKVFSFLLLIIISLFMCSCTFVNNGQEPGPSDVTEDNNENKETNNENKDDNEDNEEPESSRVIINFNFDDSRVIISDKIKNYDLSYDTKDLDIAVEKIENVIKEKKGIAELNKTYDELTSYCSSINDKYVVLRFLFFL